MTQSQLPCHIQMSVIQHVRVSTNDYSLYTHVSQNSPNPWQHPLQSLSFAIFPILQLSQSIAPASKTNFPWKLELIFLYSLFLLCLVFLLSWVKQHFYYIPISSSTSFCLPFALILHHKSQQSGREGVRFNDQQQNCLKSYHHLKIIFMHMATTCTLPDIRANMQIIMFFFHFKLLLGKFWILLSQQVTYTNVCFPWDSVSINYFL